MYWVKNPSWLPALFHPALRWRGADPQSVYLTFDDGPHPVATPFVLEQLARHGAQASFFAIGKNVAEHPGIFKATAAAGHTIGNHTHNHLNGWKTEDARYLENIDAAAALIPGRLFRPPYGRIRRSQVAALTSRPDPWTIYMWDILSGDFDTAISPERCCRNVMHALKPGAIVVFHDSAKAFDRLQYALPRVLQYCADKGWSCRAL